MHREGTEFSRKSDGFLRKPNVFDVDACLLWAGRQFPNHLLCPGLQFAELQARHATVMQRAEDEIAHSSRKAQKLPSIAKLLKTFL